jgi:hypothetical protein
MTLRLNGDSSGFTEIKAADAAGDNSIKLPASNGGANQLLKNGGTAGELEYESNVTVDSSGRLCIGNASPDFAKTANIQGSSGSVLMLSSEDTTGIQDTNASIEFRINDGASGRATAEIRAGKESATAGNQNSYISFVTRDTSNRERIRIASNGALKLLAGCPGIDFSGIQTNAAGMTSETLDSYEEGTWTPVYQGRTTNGTTSNTRTPNGIYIKVGNQVTVMWDFAQSISGGSGNVQIAGLPFLATSGPHKRYAGSIIMGVTDLTWSGDVVPYLNDGNNAIWVVQNRSGQNYAFINITGSNFESWGCMTYFVD